MMQPLLLALAVSVGDTAMADTTDVVRRAPDRWLAPDKVKHGVVAFAVQGGAYASLRLAADHRSAIAGATVLTVGLSLLKEYRDRDRTGFSIRDLAWDAAGIALATVVVSHRPAR